jgi:hypothetical protein
MKTSSNGRKFIERFEGLILGAYDDDKIRLSNRDKKSEVPSQLATVIQLLLGHQRSTSDSGSPKMLLTRYSPLTSHQ